MSYSQVPSSSRDHPVHDLEGMQNHSSPFSAASPDRVSVNRIQNGSQHSFAPTLLEHSPLDPDELRNTLLAKSIQESETKTASTQTRWDAFRQWAIDLWFWEMLLLFMSMGAFGAQIGILWTYSGRSLPDWPSGLTINALISLLSAISTSGLLSVISNIIGQNKWIWLSRDGGRLSHLELIDDASRGPWGSLVYLAAARTLNAISFASIITVCSLLTAPFVQQVVQIDYTTVATDSTLTQDRVMYHNYVDGYSAFQGNPPDILLSSIDQGVSFNRDLNDPLSRNYLQLISNCPTGNCSFDIHDSLAICSECADITSFLEVQQDYTPANYTKFYNQSSLDDHNNTIWTSGNITTDYATNNLNWTLPNGCYTESWVWLAPYWDNSMSYRTFGHCSPLKVEAEFPIANITAILPCADDEARPCLSNAKAQECSLHWCVNRYKSQIIQGYLFEEVLASSKSGRRITLPDFGYTGDQVYYELSVPESSPFPATTDPEPSQWTNGTTGRFIVGRDISASLAHFAADTLSGSDMTSRLSLRSYDLQVDSSQTSAMSRRSALGGNQSSMATIFEAVALSMTTALRSQNQPDGVDWGLTLTSGEVTTIAPVLKIQWVWLTLPASLQLGTLILLLHSRFSRTRGTIPVWKSYALATVFFGGRGSPDLGDKSVTKIVEMGEIASRVRTAGLFIEKMG